MPAVTVPDESTPNLAVVRADGTLPGDVSRPAPDAVAVRLTHLDGAR